MCRRGIQKNSAGERSRSSARKVCRSVKQERSAGEERKRWEQERGAGEESRRRRWEVSRRGKLDIGAKEIMIIISYIAKRGSWRRDRTNLK